LLLAVALYGAAGLVAATVIGLLAAGVLGAIPGGSGALVADPELDRSASSGLLSATVGVGFAAVIVAVGQAVLVRPMQSDKLATIAAAGLVLLAALPAGALAVALYRPMRRWIAPRLPRPARLGTTGALLLGGATFGVLAVLVAFSRADWRVLDLSPFLALGFAVLAGLGHGLFWYRSALGKRLTPRVPAVGLSLGLIAAILIAYVGASRLTEKSPAFAAPSRSPLSSRLQARSAATS
jgi:hypothetical protein